jgi:hypothetical protein
MYPKRIRKALLRKTECALASKENNFIDFDHEGLISKELSEGPSLAVADINDGNDDVFYRVVPKAVQEEFI